MESKFVRLTKKPGCLLIFMVLAFLMFSPLNTVQLRNPDFSTQNGQGDQSVQNTMSEPYTDVSASTKELTLNNQAIISTAQANSAFKVYLSPSCQTWNPYSDGSGSEEYHMRQIAAAMPKYLAQYGIQSVLAAPQSGSRTNQKKTIIDRVKQAASTKCNLYLSIHSNASDGGPKRNGTLIFYPSYDMSSLRFANILMNNFMYPDKSAIDFSTKDVLWEMYMPTMPHCLIETAYHDNPDDIRWIESNTEKIAQNLAYCVALYANVPVNTSTGAI